MVFFVERPNFGEAAVESAFKRLQDIGPQPLAGFLQCQARGRPGSCSRGRVRRFFGNTDRLGGLRFFVVRKRCFLA